MTHTAIVIDDDIDSVEIFCLLLEEKNVSVIGRGYNGKEAIELYKEKEPDFVFLDLNMPDGTGFHAIRSIKKINESAKIIAVTANTDFPTKRKIQKLNIHGIVFKPVEIDKVMDLISK